MNIHERFNQAQGYGFFENALRVNILFKVLFQKFLYDKNAHNEKLIHIIKLTNTK